MAGRLFAPARRALCYAAAALATVSWGSILLFHGAPWNTLVFVCAMVAMSVATGLFASLLPDLEGR